MDWNSEQDVLKALALLYSLQTADERMLQQTSHDNSVGFNATDASFMSSVAEQMLIRKKGISRKQFTLVKLTLRKYQGQINEFGIDSIDIPDTAIVYENGDNTQTGDGLISVARDRLLFKPYIYPSTQIKSIGFRWAQDGSKCWESHLNLSAFTDLTDMFPHYTLHESAVEWLNEVHTLPEVSEETAKSDLFSFQKEAVGFMLKAQRGLLGLAPGLGKTPTAIMGIKEFGGRTLVVCPVSLLYNWRREIKTWAKEDAEIWHAFIGKNESPWVITNYETVLGYLTTHDIKEVIKNGKVQKERVNWRPVEQFGFDNIIIDESILIKNRKAQRSLAVDTIIQKTATAKRVFLLSGSPTSKFFDDLWYQFHVIEPKRFTSYWKFANEFCVVEKNHWGTAITNNRPEAASKIKQKYRDIYFARTQDQVLDLPDWIFDTVEVPMAAQQSKLYMEMQNNFVATLPEGDKIVAPNILAQMIRLLQLASNPALVGGPKEHPKWDAAIDLLGFEQLPAIVWTNFIETAHSLTSLLRSKKYRVDMLAGETKTAERDIIVQMFQGGDLDVIVAHPGVGKFGLTLTAARTAIYVERSYNGDDYYQSLHRVRRIGTTVSPHVLILLSNYMRKENDELIEEPTIDHVVHKVLGFKRETSIKITTGLIREVLNV